MAMAFAQTPPHDENERDGKRTPPKGKPPLDKGSTNRVVSDLVQLFKLLADETRLRILFFLRQTGELNVLELCSRLRQRQPSVSHHLALLRVAGLIEMRRQGKHNYYRVLPRRFEELIGLLFDGSQGRPSRIRFDEFELRYAPVQQDV